MQHQKQNIGDEKEFFISAFFALLIALSLSLSMRVQAQFSSALLRLPKTQRDLDGGFARQLALGAGGTYSPNGLYNLSYCF